MTWTVPLTSPSSHLPATIGSTGETWQEPRLARVCPLGDTPSHFSPCHQTIPLSSHYSTVYTSVTLRHQSDSNTFFLTTVRDGKEMKRSWSCPPTILTQMQCPTTISTLFQWPQGKRLHVNFSQRTVSTPTYSSGAQNTFLPLSLPLSLINPSIVGALRGLEGTSGV